MQQGHDSRRMFIVEHMHVCKSVYIYVYVSISVSLLLPIIQFLIIVYLIVKFIQMVQILEDIKKELRALRGDYREVERETFST